MADASEIRAQIKAMRNALKVQENTEKIGRFPDRLSRMTEMIRESNVSSDVRQNIAQNTKYLLKALTGKEVMLVLEKDPSKE